LLCVGLLLLLPLPKNSYAFEWHDLWQSKDQQAQQAFNKNKFEQAANLFENRDWKAVAHYKAGEYDKALENLKSNQTELSAYNQGNALAKSGQLEQAIKAYEKALTLKPDDADAKYNKELVEKELEKQKQDQQKQDKKEDQSKENSEQQKTNDKSEKSEDHKASEQKPEQSNERKSEQQKADEQKADEDKEQQDKKDNKQAEEAKAQQTEEKKPDDSKADKEKSVSAQEKPSTEEQQANEQWLKRIPDDPAGLLKRKFKYQYGQRNH
jgi:Ca-activated chloride channel family protein